MKKSFFFITSEVAFDEFEILPTLFEEGKGKKKGARILATFMELDTPSQNSRIYRFVEGKKIAQSLVGKLIRYGANWFGKHFKKVPVIGIVEEAYQKGKKIMGIVRIWDQGIIETLKKGTKYLFSVGGMADFGKMVKKGGKFFTKLYNALCTHLQLLPNDPEGAGFPSAKMHKVIEINESVMLAQGETKVCDIYGCKILKDIHDTFQEAVAIEGAISDAIEEKAISRAVAIDISVIIDHITEFRELIEKEN